MTTPADDRIERAGQRYEAAVFGGDHDGLAAADRDLDAVEADLALARGRVLHARFLAERASGTPAEDPRERQSFERAAGLYAALGDERGEGEAHGWLGIYHQVVRGDDDAAAPELARAAELAGRSGDDLTLSYALRHQGIAAHRAGRTAEARDRLEESTRLRRKAGHLPGVAANLVGLVHVAVDEGRREDALALAAEAEEAARESDAHAIAGFVAEARARAEAQG